MKYAFSGNVKFSLEEALGMMKYDSTNIVQQITFIKLEIPHIYS
jgi:hypothetical protein